jgi:hypothetical protein
VLWTPYPHFHLTDVFHPQLYDCLVQKMPETLAAFKSLAAPDDRKADAAQKRRFSVQLLDQDLGTGKVRATGLDHPAAHERGARALGLESRHIESRPKAAARLDLEVSAGWASMSSRGLWGGGALLLSTGAAGSHPKGSRRGGGRVIGSRWWARFARRSLWRRRGPSRAARTPCSRPTAHPWRSRSGTSWRLCSTRPGCVSRSSPSSTPCYRSVSKRTSLIRPAGYPHPWVRVRVRVESSSRQLH